LPYVDAATALLNEECLLVDRRHSPNTHPRSNGSNSRGKAA
jgi:hypothetical protein